MGEFKEVREEEDVKTVRGFVEEDFGSGAVKEGEFLVSLAGWMRDVIGFLFWCQVVNH